MRIILTPGEPAGIGPELAIRAAQQAQDFELAAVCDPKLLHQTAGALNVNLNLRVIDMHAPPRPTNTGELACLPIPLRTAAKPGILDKANAPYVLETLANAGECCLAGCAQALVTGPVQKSIINDAGVAFSGHTEFFAQQATAGKVVMMLATEGLRVALATTHLPLKDVPAAITQPELAHTLTILCRELTQTFRIKQPRVLVCGLNPHAGEGGHLGHEELETIIPVLERMRAEGHKLVGPLPADTLFTPHWLNDADAVLAMYHDQGLPVLKYKGFGSAVNITLGLPYIRTSVDHGTALDLAGSGKADSGSMFYAIEQARALAHAKFTEDL